MDRWISKIAVVTGASAGIGLATTKALVQHGMIVIGLARRKEKMEEEMKELANAKGKFMAVQCDVSKEFEVKHAFQWVKENVGIVQVLVNNAGYAVPGGFSETTSHVWNGVISVNLMGSVYCAKEAITQMQETKLDGHIININSVQGHRVRKFGSMDVNIYPASKHAITGFTETLQRELIGQNIRVTSISPGLVATEIVRSNKLNPDMLKEPGLEPSDIADAVVYALGTPQRVQITELTIRPLGERAL